MEIVDVVDLKNRFEKIRELFEKLYCVYQRKDNYVPKMYNGKWWPSQFLDTEFDIEVMVSISSANLDIKHEEDDYAHALRHAALKVVNNLECYLSDCFNHIYLAILYEKRMFFDDVKRYTYPYRVFEKGKGGLRNFISTSYSEESWFSHQFFIMNVYAYKDKPDMYLSYKGKILISEDEYKDLIRRIDIEVEILKEIYMDYYQDVFVPMYKQTDAFIDGYMEVRNCFRDKKGFRLAHKEIIDRLENIYNSLLKQYESAIDKENIEKYIRLKRN